MPTVRPRPDLAALGIVALIIIATTVCALLHVQAPGFLSELAWSIGGGALGVALNHNLSSSDSGAAAAEEPAPAPTAPAFAHTR